MANRYSSSLRHKRFTTGAVTLFTVLLFGCGGSEVTESNPAAFPSTSLDRPDGETSRIAVPAAPAPGEVLYADALVLRPLADEAVWVYRGVRTGPSGSAPYSSFRQTRQTVNGFQEHVSSPLVNASRIRTLTPQAAQISLEESLPLATGFGAVRAAELRSPVRKDEQITLAEAQGLKLAEDLDNDGKPDLVDLAAWSRVVGNEDVELPELERTVRALRVDTTLVSRVHRSSQAQPDARLTVVESHWYAPGIGIIRNSRTQPSTQGQGAVERDERLQMWDGVQSGMGLIPSTPVSMSGSASTIGPWLGRPTAATRVGSDVFLLSRTQPARADSLTLSVIDRRGRLLRSVEHIGLGTAEPTGGAQLMPLGDGVALARREEGVYLYPDQLENLKLTRFNAQAQRTGRDIWLVDGAMAGSLNAASDGQTVWVTWVDPGSAGQSNRLMLQAFDAVGDVRTQVFILDVPGVGSTIGQIAIAAHQGRVEVTWRAQTSQGVTWRTAVASTAAEPSVGVVMSSSTVDINTGATLTPLLTESLAALSWLHPLERSPGVIAPRALALNTNGQSRRATSGALDQELLALPTGSLQSAERMVLAAEAKAVLWAAAGTGRLRGDTDAPDRTLSFAVVDAGDAALAAAAPQLRRLRDSAPDRSWEGSVQALTHIIPMADRWLILGHDGSRATVAVLHKR